jgi:RNA ligase
MGKKKNAEHVPWPSIDNLGVHFAQLIFKREDVLRLVSTGIQRWWRFHNLRKKRGEPYVSPKEGGAAQPVWAPLVVGKPEISLARVCSWARNWRDNFPLNFLAKEARASEKLDGTNVGVTDRGVLMGRRHLIPDGQLHYQRIPLSTIPRDAVAAAAAALSRILGGPRVVLYGELMCNPGKFGYNNRKLPHWNCFGARVWFDVTEESEDDDNGASAPTQKEADADADTDTNQSADGPQRVIALAERCIEAGFWVAGGIPRLSENIEADRKLTLLLNSVLVEQLTAHGVPVVPLASGEGGILADVVKQLADRMMDNSVWEGVVIHSPTGAVKWKTGLEDESAGSQDLARVSEGMPSFLVHEKEVEFARILQRVSANGAPKKRQRNQKREKAEAQPDPYDEHRMRLAAESALSKYDSADAYFERNEMPKFATLLAREMVEDLAPSTPLETTFIEKYARRRVGTLFGAWKREQSMIEKRMGALTENE